MNPFIKIALFIILIISIIRITKYLINKYEIKYIKYINILTLIPFYLLITIIVGSIWTRLRFYTSNVRIGSSLQSSNNEIFGELSSYQNYSSIEIETISNEILYEISFNIKATEENSYNFTIFNEDDYALNEAIHLNEKENHKITFNINLDLSKFESFTIFIDDINNNNSLIKITKLRFKTT